MMPFAFDRSGREKPPSGGIGPAPRGGGAVEAVEPQASVRTDNKAIPPHERALPANRTPSHDFMWSI